MLSNDQIDDMWEAASSATEDTMDVHQFARAVEVAAYEKAAQACEALCGPIESYNRAYPNFMDCANAIRALKEQPK